MRLTQQVCCAKQIATKKSPSKKKNKKEDKAVRVRSQRALRQ